MTEHDSPGQPEPAAGDAQEASGEPDKPASSGVRSRLTEAQRAMLESKSRGGDAGLRSVGKSHKPTHASGKQGPAEKKVRW